VNGFSGGIYDEARRGKCCAHIHEAGIRGGFWKALRFGGAFSPTAWQSTRVRSALLFLGLSLVSAAAGVPGDLVANGGFELGLLGWRPLWNRQTGAGKVSLDQQIVHAGTNSARIEHQGTEDWSFEPEVRVAVQPGDLGATARRWLRHPLRFHLGCSGSERKLVLRRAQHPRFLGLDTPAHAICGSPGSDANPAPPDWLWKSHRLGG
jgi:hypothetical protein